MTTDSPRPARALSESSLVGVSGSASDETRSLLDAMAALIDWSAHAVCEPRRFHENENSAQQELGQAVARARRALTESRSLVGLSADVSRLTAAIERYVEEDRRYQRRISTSALEASLRDAGEATG